jgi:hypothetical protein
MNNKSLSCALRIKNKYTHLPSTQIFISFKCFYSTCYVHIPHMLGKLFGDTYRGITWAAEVIFGGYYDRALNQGV